MKNTFSRQIILSIIGFALLVVAVIGISYAVQVVFVDEKSNMVIAPSIYLSINNKKTNQISFHSLKPVSDSYALSIKYKNTFEILVSSKIPTNEKLFYEITLEPNNRLDSIMRVATFENDSSSYQVIQNPISISNLEKSSLNPDEYLLYSGAFLNMESKDIHYYKKIQLRAWLSQKVQDSYSNVFYHIHVYAKKVQ